MFMDKSELINARNLTVIRLKNTRKKWIWAIVVTWVWLTGTLAPALFKTFTSIDGIIDIHIQDFSTLFLGALSCAIIIQLCLYRNTNQQYSVYPQNNTSRFFAEQLIYHIWIAIFAVAALALYLLQYAIFALIATVYPNVILVYRFSLSFVIVGFFIMIINMFMITSVVTLIAVLIRKYTIYAALWFMIIGVSIIINIGKPGIIFTIIFDFWLQEKSLLLYSVKGIILWAVLTGVSFIINKFTVYYTSGIKISKAIIAVITVLGIIALCVVPLIYVSKKDQYSISSSSSDTVYPGSVNQEIVIDAANIPKGSKIDIKTTNIITDDASEKLYGGNMAMQLCVSDPGMLSHFTGNKILLECYLPYNMSNYADLSPFAEPIVTARLDGTTLYVVYRYIKNVKVIFVPMWSFMGQFEYFKGKNIFQEFAGTSSGSGPGSINVSVK